MKNISCGVLITKKINDEMHLLMCHSTNNTFWDIPKGGIDLDESPIDTAIRELKEETGFSVSREDLIDLGIFEYNRSKDLHLFKYNKDSDFDESKGVCTTFFQCPYKKIDIPEVDEFKYFPFSLVNTVCAKSFINVFKKITTII